MKTKIKCKTLVIAVLLLGFSSCSKDNDTIVNTKSIFLKISNRPVTYAEGAVQGDVPLTFSSGHIYFTDAASTILRYHSIGDTDADHTVAELTAGKEIADLPITVTAIYVVGNTQGLPNTTKISEVKAYVLNVESQVEVAAGNVVNLYGETEELTQVEATNLYTTTVSIVPTVARIELTDIKATGRITSFKVAGIFVDNYYATAPVDGTITSSLVDNGTDVLQFSDNTTSYPKTLKPSIFDWYTEGLASVENVVKPTEAVWGYNLFAKTNGENDAPRIIIRLTDIVTSGGASYADPQFITLNGFNENGVPLTTIKPGNVYTIAAGGFNFDETNLTSAPNMETMGVAVKVTVPSWVNVPITPNM